MTRKMIYISQDADTYKLLLNCKSHTLSESGGHFFFYFGTTTNRSKYVITVANF